MTRYQLSPHAITSDDAPHRALRIAWDPEMPPQYRQSLEPLVMCYAPLLPSWCRELLVKYDTERKGSLLEARSVVEYHWVRINVSSKWFEQPEYEMGQAVRHEMLHAAVAPLVDMLAHVHELLSQHSEDAAKAVDDLRRVAMERVVCDLEEIIGGIQQDREEVDSQDFPPTG